MLYELKSNASVPRFLVVIVNGQNSEKGLVDCDIPQGSCLGPLLFILYTNDFEESLTKYTPNMYADNNDIK